MTQITIRGRLAGDVELRFVPSGVAVANLTIVANKRVKNGDQWEDGPATFWRCSAWRDLAENIASSLHKGTSVVAVGEALQREWTTSEGEKRTVIEVTLDAIGPDLRWQTAKVTKAERKGGGFGQQPAGDPWATGQQQQNPTWNPAPATDEIPF